MAIVTEISTPTDIPEPSSTPRRVLQQVPSIELEVENIVPLGNEAIPFVWAWGDNLQEFEHAIRTDPMVTQVTRVQQVDGGALYRVNWTVDSPLMICIHQANGALIEAYGNAEEWKLTIWFERQAHAQSFQKCCSIQDVPMKVTRIRSIVDHSPRNTSSITQNQREILTLAYDDGYFKDPRETTQEELGAELEISSSAVSSLLRRGIGNLIKDTIVH